MTARRSLVVAVAALASARAARAEPAPSPAPANAKPNAPTGEPAAATKPPAKPSPAVDANHAVDVRLALEPPVRRHAAIVVNPLALVVGKLSADLVVIPVDHHALVVNAFYFGATTAPIYVFDASGAAMQLPEQRFAGGGVELGYRYYRGLGGPRGLFIGPSLVLASIKEHQLPPTGDDSSFRFTDIGVAVDVGYQVLVTDQITLAIGAGVQALATSRSIPAQQFPAKVYANGGVLPRLLLSAGWAF